MNMTAMRNTNRFSALFGLGLFALLAWAPVLAWLGSIFDISIHDAWLLAFAGGRRLQVLGETLVYAVGAAATAVAIGSSAALYCWRRHNSLARATGWIAYLSLPFPPYLHALAWMPLLAALPGRGTGWWSAGWVQALAMAPFAFGLTRLAMGRLDDRWIEAARVYGGDRRLLLRVLAPALAPPVLAAFSPRVSADAGGPIRAVAVLPQRLLAGDLRGLQRLPRSGAGALDVYAVDRRRAAGARTGAPLLAGCRAAARVRPS